MPNDNSDAVPGSERVIVQNDEDVARQCRESQRRVIIIGAGITGLTAAHELAERGFKVAVIERNPPSIAEDFDRHPDPDAIPPVTRAGRRDRWWSGLLASTATTTAVETIADQISREVGPDVGGIARTQWPMLPEDACVAPGGGRARRAGEDTTPLRRAIYPAAPLHVQNGALHRYEPSTRVSVRFGPTDEPVDFEESVRDALVKRAKERPGQPVAIVARAIIYLPTETPTAEVRRAAERDALAHLDRSVTLLAESLQGQLDADDDADLHDAVRRIRLLDVPASEIRIGVSKEERAAFDVYAGRRLIPGEHGYRFFAGFYRHLRDTMKRTPIWDRQERRFLDRTTHDNLKEVEWQAIGDPERPFATAFSRCPPRSLAAAVQQYQRLQRELGYRPSDMLRFMLRMARYATSASRRRELCYEQLTWWDFLSLRDLRSRPTSPTPTNGLPDIPDDQRVEYGRRAKQALLHAPQALVAMRGDTADARTQGTVTLQLMLDNFGLNEMTDSTLIGPTSEVWFKHWRDYLERQGVVFILAEAEAIQKVDQLAGADSATWVPVGDQLALRFADAVPAQLLEWIEQGQSDDAPPCPADYVLVATDVLAANRLVKDLALTTEREVLEAIEKIAEPDAAGFASTTRFGIGVGPTDPVELTVREGLSVWYPFQTITGVQLFYPSKVGFADAHIYYAQSPWGLSAVSQFQYWRTYLANGEARFLGNLSVDLGRWDKGSDEFRIEELRTMPSPANLSVEEVANCIERQIEICMGTHMSGRLPRCVFAYMDAYIEFDSKRSRPVKNHYPFLVNNAGDWVNRPPGAPWAPTDPWNRLRLPGSSLDAPDAEVWSRYRPLRADEAQTSDGVRDGYLMHYGSLVFAGIYMRTFTRINSMEAANESARHAVNAILDHMVFGELDPAERARLVPDGADLERWAGGPNEASLPHYAPTRFGDYCQIWDPERHEPAELEFLKLIDACLMRAAEREANRQADPYGRDRPEPPPAESKECDDYPHVFDLLCIDELADLIECDDDAERVIRILVDCVSDLSKVDMQSTSDLWCKIEATRQRICDYVASVSR